MFRLGLLLSFSLLFACADDRPHPGPQGGSGGDEGPQPLDETPPTISLQAPDDGLVVEDPTIWLEGLASDETGVEELILRIARRSIPIDYLPGREIGFRFEVQVSEGENLLEIEARDRAGNRSHVERSITYRNTPGRPPVIEFFRSDPEIVAQDGEFTLHWRVTGTQPIALTLLSQGNETSDVTGLESLPGITSEADREHLLLVAQNAAGVATEELFLGIGEELRLWPVGATILPGARQRIEALNAENVEWETDAGVTEALGGLRPAYTFHASEPGTYRLTATSTDPITRTASITIRVEEKALPGVGFHGRGGQFGKISGWTHPTPVIDADGSLLVSHPGGHGMSRYLPDTDTWIVGEGPLAHLQLASDGRLFGAIGGRLFVRNPGSTELHVVPTGWDPMQQIESLRLGQDGSLLAIVRREGRHPTELWIVSPDGTSAEVDLPVGLVPQAATTWADGRLLMIGGDVPLASMIYVREPEGDWTALRLHYDVQALVLSRAGELFVAGSRGPVMAFDGETWSELQAGLPRCVLDQNCGVQDLYETSDGGLLAVTDGAVHELMGDRTFRQVGEPAPWMARKGGSSGALRALTEAADGTLYLAGDAGVFRLSPGAPAWAAVGARGLPPNNGAMGLIIQPDGAWILAGGGTDRQPGSHSLFQRQAGSQSWEPLGDDLGRLGFPDQVWQIGRDGAGHIYGITASYDVFRLDLQTQTSNALPTPMRPVEGFWKMIPDLGVGFDGTLFLATSDRVQRLAPGAQAWSADPEMGHIDHFLQGVDGTLWAAGAFGPKRLPPSSKNWELVGAGLSPDFFTRYGGNHLSSAADGSVLLASDRGAFRLPSGGRRWQRLGFGDPSFRADRITTGGGRTWALSGLTLYELSETNTWMPIGRDLPVEIGNITVFQATPEGTLLLSDGEIWTGLLESFDRQ